MKRQRFSEGIVMVMLLACCRREQNVGAGFSPPAEDARLKPGATSVTATSRTIGDTMELTITPVARASGPPSRRLPAGEDELRQDAGATAGWKPALPTP
ncbi:MAG TPA: hypothetical protein VNA69_24865 [Thermoanaerobaculia bacterium]|nr:hypothetical protein [Thermoanaerobaculia bacterium]